MFELNSNYKRSNCCFSNQLRCHSAVKFILSESSPDQFDCKPFKEKHNSILRKGFSKLRKFGINWQYCRDLKVEALFAIFVYTLHGLHLFDVPQTGKHPPLGRQHHSHRKQNTNVSQNTEPWLNVSFWRAGVKR